MVETQSLSGNIIRMFYELFSHNYIPITYFFLLLISLFFAVKKPTRPNLLLVLGFFLLLFNYEYDKHISEGLRDQTQMSLTQGSTHRKVSILISFVTEFMFPIFIYLAGCGLISSN